MVRTFSPIVRRGSKIRSGKGFSKKEIKSANLSITDARHLGVPVDLNRRTSYNENIEKLNTWVEHARSEGIRIPNPRQFSKGQRGRAHRGLTSSGKKIRGLRKT